jgi:8-oxo-dGTP diphosphatase
MIYKSGKVLIGKRIGSHGAHTWSFPGGHVEADEAPEVAAKREVFEETGLEIGHLTPAGFSVDHFEENKTDYLTLFYRCEWTAGIPEVREKEKCLEWRWSTLEDLPQPLFLPIESFLRQANSPW